MRFFKLRGKSTKIYPNSSYTIYICEQRAYSSYWYKVYYHLKHYYVKVEFVDFGNSDLVDPEQVYSIPPGLVTCLPAQAVPCTLAGNYGTQSENLIQPFLTLVKDNVFRIKVGNSLRGRSYSIEHQYNGKVFICQQIGIKI